MILVFSIIFIILFISTLVVSVLLLFKTKTSIKVKKIELLQDILDRRAFYPKKIVMVHKHFFLALNKNLSRLAIIENFNSKTLSYNYDEIALQFITGIEQLSSKTFKIDYIHQGEKKSIIIRSYNKEVKDFIYSIFKIANIKRIKDKFPECNFSITSTSDFENSYVWAFCPVNNSFVYFKTKDDPFLKKINLRKNYFTVDTKYNYFEIELMNEKQQLIIYDNLFLKELFASIYQNIKQKTSEMTENLIYYDDYCNIVYISNGISSLQSVLLNKPYKQIQLHYRPDHQWTDKRILHP